MADLFPSTCTFQVRHDDFSTQVSCEQDRMFWFRLEVAEGRDNITDFSLGAFATLALAAISLQRVTRRPANYLSAASFFAIFCLLGRAILRP